MNFSVGYTWSKNLGFIPPSGVQGGAAMPWLYRTYDYGPLPTDIASNFEATGIYELPFGKTKRWVSSGKSANVVGGWQISVLFSDFTGRPFSVVANNNLNANNSYQRASCVGTPKQIGASCNGTIRRRSRRLRRTRSELAAKTCCAARA